MLSNSSQSEIMYCITFYPYPGDENGSKRMEEEMATHLSILAWGIPWTEEPDGLQFIASQRVSDTTEVT